MQIYNIYKLLYGFGDKKMAPKMTIRIDPEIKDSFSKLVRTEGKSPSEVLRELIKDYIKESDIRIFIDDLWNRIGAKLGSRDLKQRDINRVIKKAILMKAETRSG
jgi:predicted DNA-binding protein